jgi:ribosome-associated translation inhibitor RaiA
MHITVAGKGVETGEALKKHVTDGLAAVARKYFDHALDAHVTFRRDRTFFACDINLRAGRGLSMRAEGTESTPTAPSPMPPPISASACAATGAA